MCLIYPSIPDESATSGTWISFHPCKYRKLSHTTLYPIQLTNLWIAPSIIWIYSCFYFENFYLIFHQKNNTNHHSKRVIGILKKKNNQKNPKLQCKEHIQSIMGLIVFSRNYAPFSKPFMQIFYYCEEVWNKKWIHYLEDIRQFNNYRFFNWTQPHLG